MSRVTYYLPWEMVTPDELIAFLTIITAKAIFSLNIINAKYYDSGRCIDQTEGFQFMLSITLIWFLTRVHMMMRGVHNYVNRLMEAEDHVEQVKISFALFRKG